MGLVIDPEIAGDSGGSYMANNIFTLYGAFPKQWIDDGSGNAIYGSVQPEMKGARSVTFVTTKKLEKQPFSSENGCFYGCGGRTRTYDLRVISPTSFQLLYSAIFCCTP